MIGLRGSKLAVRLLTVSLILSTNIGLASPLFAQEEPASARGRAIFQSRCAPCHTVGGGDLAGPDLKGVTARRDAAWLDRFIREPDVVIKSKDPIALELLRKYSGLAMPNLGITESDAALLLDYLAESAPPGTAPAVPPQRGAPAAAGTAPEAPAEQAPPGPSAQPAAPAPAAALPPGDPAAGKALFTGRKLFQNRGAQCFACHAVASFMPPNGGSLGPDLTGAFRKYGGTQGLAAVLSGAPFPTMVPVYHAHALTPQEQADLAAFLGAAAGVPAPMTLFVACLAVWGMGGLYVILYAIWRNRPGGGRLGRVRASLQAR
jgi:mono/diheme cytochrome c family protein